MAALVQRAQKYFHCNVCAEKFHDADTFLVHMKILNGKLECVGTKPENFGNIFDHKRRCQFCEKKFSTDTNLKRHVDQVHERKKNHMCKVCHKSFFTSRDLWVHSSAVHDNSKTFKCKSCEKTFSQKGNMKTHYETQHLGIRNFKCNFCGETFTQNQYLQNHLKRNHKDKTKPLVIKIKNVIFETALNHMALLQHNPNAELHNNFHS